MSGVPAVSAGMPAPPPIAAQAPPQLSVLPAPEGTPAEPADLLATLLVLMEEQSAVTMGATENKIEAAKALLKEKLEQFLKQLKEALEAAAKAKEEDGGLFSDIVGSVADIVGDVLGTIADFAVDAVEMPFELAVGFAKNLADGRLSLDALGAQLVELTSNGGVAADVDGFTEGVGKFAADLAVALPKLEATIARALVTGENVWEAIEGEAKALWQSLEQNILANPEFWAVAGAIAKGLAVATAVVSGGTLSAVALGLMVLSELDARTNFITELVGEEAAPWVKLGIGVATSLCLGIGAATGEANALLKGLNIGVGVVNGAGQAYQAYQTMKTADLRADELEREAALTQTLNRMQQLQRLIENLLGELTEQGEDRTTVRELGSEIAQVQATTQGALIMRA